MTRYTTPSNTIITTTKKLGEGGEGAVFDVAGQSALVAKIYHPARLNASLAAKVIAMTRNPPEDATRASLNHVSIAWPTDVLYSGKKFVGYTMPKIKKSDDLYDLLQPQQRAKEHSGLNHRHLYRTARNLAIAMDAIHRKGYVVGDVNFKNALFNDDALITMVDCDSLQVTDSAGVVHHCLVGVPEYTPADLQGKDFGRVTRTPNHDAFGLAILIFQMLMQGFHPFAGRPKPGVPDVEQAHIYCISKGIFPYLVGQPYEPPPAAPSMLCLPVLLQQQFERAFTQPNARPTPKDWANLLAMVETRLVPCPNDQSHWYPSDGHCVICEIDYNVGRRIRTSPKPSTTVQMQVPLPPQPSITTGPLRPSAISKPHVAPPTPQTPALNKPTVPRTAPATPVAPANPAPSRPTQTTPTVQSPSIPTQTLPPLVSPNPVRPTPRTTPSVPAPQTGRSVPFDIIATISTYVQQHRMMVIPIAVIFMALVIVVVSNFNSAGDSSTAAVSVPSNAEPTIGIIAATRTRVARATTVPAAPIEGANAIIPTDGIGACTPVNIVAAHWKMLSPAKQSQMLKNLEQLRTKPYKADVLQLSGADLIGGGSGTQFPDLQALCTDVRLLQSNPLRYDASSPLQGSQLCTKPTCTLVAPEYRLVFVKNDVASKSNFYSSDSLLEHFFDQNNPPAIASVGLQLQDARVPGTFESLLTPFVQIPLLEMKVNNPIWTTKIGDSEQRMVDVNVGDLFYTGEEGLSPAREPSRQNQYYRIVKVPLQRWTDGVTVKPSDYINGFEKNINMTRGLIESVIMADSTSIEIRYAPGLPKELADAIAPVALHRNELLTNSMGEWLFSGAGNSFRLEHITDSRKSFSIDMPANVQQLARQIRMGTYDVAIIDPEYAPEVLDILLGVDLTAYTMMLIPSGTTWVIQN